MAAPGSSPIAIAFEGVSGSGLIPTPVLLAGMLRASEKVSDLIFSPGWSANGRRDFRGERSFCRRYAPHRGRPDRHQQTSYQYPTRAGLLRCFVWIARHGALSGQRLHPAGKLRNCHARHPYFDSQFFLFAFAGSVGGSGASAQRDRPGDWGKRIG